MFNSSAFLVGMIVLGISGAIVLAVAIIRRARATRWVSIATLSASFFMTIGLAVYHSPFVEWAIGNVIISLIIWGLVVLLIWTFVSLLIRGNRSRPNRRASV